MKTPRELDIVEVVTDGAEVPRGTRATVVHDFRDGNLMLEVVRPDGQAAAMPIVAPQDVRVVWRAGEKVPEAAAAEQHGGTPELTSQYRQ